MLLLGKVAGGGGLHYPAAWGQIWGETQCQLLHYIRGFFLTPIAPNLLNTGELFSFPALWKIIDNEIKWRRAHVSGGLWRMWRLRADGRQSRDTISIAKRIALGVFMVIIAVSLPAAVRWVNYVGANILFGVRGHTQMRAGAHGYTLLQTHQLAIIPLSHTCELCHCQLKPSPGAISTPTHTHTHLEGVYTYPIMTNHPFHWLSHLRGLLQQCQLRWGKRRLTDMESLNLATAFTFMLSGCFISLCSLRFRRSKFLKNEFNLVVFFSSQFTFFSFFLARWVSLCVRQLLNSWQFNAV